MIRSETPAETAFRADVRAWLEAAVPPHLAHTTFRPEPAEAMAWHRALTAKGWVAPNWPKAHGGMGATPVEQVIMWEEFARAGTPDFPTQGLNHIGPLLMKSGSPAQIARHLPPIIAGDVIWCQGYSEPGSGSDLASLQTKARIAGDRLIIDGSKIWTTWGHHADWMFALVRTSGKRREGITFVMFPMDSPGITVRPITTIAGDDEFAEVFFDSVSVPLENVVGQIDEGWKVATALLDEERMHLGTPAQTNRALVRLERLVSQMAGERQRAWEGRLDAAREAVEAVTAAFLDTAERFAAGVAVPNESSILKLLNTEAVHMILDLVQEAAGGFAAKEGPLMHGGARLDLNEMYLQARRLPIYGGANEIQRAILATRIMGLNGGRA